MALRGTETDRRSSRRAGAKVGKGGGPRRSTRRRDHRGLRLFPTDRRTTFKGPTTSMCPGRCASVVAAATKVPHPIALIREAPNQHRGPPFERFVFCYAVGLPAARLFLSAQSSQSTPVGTAEVFNADVGEYPTRDYFRGPRVAGSRETREASLKPRKRAARRSNAS